MGLPSQEGFGADCQLCQHQMEKEWYFNDSPTVASLTGPLSVSLQWSSWCRARAPGSDAHQCHSQCWLLADESQGTGQGLLALTLPPEPYSSDLLLVFLSSLLLSPASPLLTLLTTPSCPCLQGKSSLFLLCLLLALGWLPKVTSTLPQLQCSRKAAMCGFC